MAAPSFSSGMLVCGQTQLSQHAGGDVHTGVERMRVSKTKSGHPDHSAAQESFVDSKCTEIYKTLSRNKDFFFYLQIPDQYQCSEY